MLLEKIARGSVVLSLTFLVGGCVSSGNVVYEGDYRGNKIKDEMKEKREQRRYHLRQKNYNVPKTELAYGA